MIILIVILIHWSDLSYICPTKQREMIGTKKKSFKTQHWLQVCVCSGSKMFWSADHLRLPWHICEAGSESVGGEHEFCGRPLPWPAAHKTRPCYERLLQWIWSRCSLLFGNSSGFGSEGFEPANEREVLNKIILFSFLHLVFHSVFLVW